jgi:hypothetical protein
MIGRRRDPVDAAMVTTSGGPIRRRMRVWAGETP